MERESELESVDGGRSEAVGRQEGSSRQAEKRQEGARRKSEGSPRGARRELLLPDKKWL